MNRLRPLFIFLLSCFLASCDACSGEEQLLQDRPPLTRDETPPPNEEEETTTISATFQLVAHNGTKRSADTATAVTRKVDVEMTFSEAVDKTLVERSFSFLRGAEKIRGRFSWNAEKTAATFSPEQQLFPTTVYNLELKKIPAFRSRKAMNELKASFTTARNKDLNGDGINDLMIGAPYANREKGILHLYSGKNFSMSNTSPLLELSGQTEPERFGIASAFLGDLDGDGVDEIAIGAMLTPEANEPRGAVFIYSGKGLATGNQTPLIRIPGPAVGVWFGVSMANVGDINADRVDDFAIAAPFANEGSNRDIGKVFLYDGAKECHTSCNAHR